jgi:hypothetical protein
MPNTIPVKDATGTPQTLDTQGSKIDATTMPTGGYGPMGWLSAIYDRLVNLLSRWPAALVSGRLDVNVGAALPAGTNNIGDVDIASLPNEGQQTMANSISVAIASNQTNLPVDIISGSSAGTEYVEGATDTTITGTAILWEDTSDALRPVSNAKPMPVQQAALSPTNDGVSIGVSAAAPGMISYRNAALSNTAQAVKASAGRTYGWSFTNPGTADAWVHVYDVAAGSVTVGTTNALWTWIVPAQGANGDSFPAPLEHGTAIAIAATTGPTNGTAPATALVAYVGYK